MLPPDTFAGRVAFITGGGTGLGLAMARYLAAHGADLVLCARNAERLAAAAAELRASGRRVLALPADIRQPEQVQVAFGLDRRARHGPFGGGQGRHHRSHPLPRRRRWRTWPRTCSVTTPPTSTARSLPSAAAPG